MTWAKGLLGNHSGQLCVEARWPKGVTLRTHNTFESLSRAWFRGEGEGAVMPQSSLLSSSVAWLGPLIPTGGGGRGRVTVCLEPLLLPTSDPSLCGRMSRWPGSGVATKWRGAAVHWLWSTC